MLKISNSVLLKLSGFDCVFLKELRTILGSLRNQHCIRYARIRVFSIDTRCRFNGNATSYDIVKRRIDVKTTSCVYMVPM